MAQSSVRSSGQASTPVVVEPIDPDLLSEPLEFLFAEHYRQRAVLNHLERLAAEPSREARSKIARMVLRFLQVDLVHHVADEEEDLFPLMRARCEPNDGIETVFKVLAAEHAADAALVADVAVGLQAVIAAPHLSPETFPAAVRAFVETQRRHLAWENALILPLARRRLQPADLEALGQRMARRRGVRKSRTRLQTGAPS